MLAGVWLWIPKMRTGNWKGVFVLACSLVAGCGNGNDFNPAGSDAPPTGAAPATAMLRVFDSLAFNQPLAMLQAPGDSSRWFVVERSGFVRSFANSPGVSSSMVFLDIRGIVDSTASEAGLLGIAFHPGFPVTPEVFVSYTRTGSPLVSYISRFFSTDNGQTLDAGSEEIILTVLQSSTNHNGGNVMFGPDRNLYIGFGDGGGSGDPDGNGQNPGNLLGNIVRINIDGGTPYEIPAGNPFAINARCVQGFGSAPCPEIFAWGFRNPWRFSFDAVTEKLWVGDVGQAAWEEINVVEAGGNYGWNVREGAHCFSPPSDCADTFIDPITEYDHSLGASVTGGYVYRGSAIPALVGWYVFADFISGRLFAIPEDSLAGVTPMVLDETGLMIASFGVDTDDELYVVHYGAGTLHQITAAP